MEDTDIFVDFETYCKQCKHKDVKEEKDPCHICLSNPVNRNSSKPTEFVEKEKE